MQNTSFRGATGAAAVVAQSFFMQVYIWMALGLLATGIFAYCTANTSAMADVILGNKIVFYGLIVVNLGIVWGLSSSIQSLSATAASFLFFVYSAVNGLTLASIFLLYTEESIATTFFITAGMFGAMAVYGYVTKADLSRWGNILFMALIGILVAGVVNMFLESTALMWVVSCAGILIFVGFTAYDTQKLKRLAGNLDGEEMIGKFAVLGALTLYLDFINIFLYLLSISGKRR